MSKRIILISFDTLALLTIVWFSFSFRFGDYFVPNAEQALLMLAAPAIAIPIFVRLGLYRAVLRYLPERAIWTILQAVTISTLVWVSLAFLTQMTGAQGVPRTIPVVYWFLSVAAIVVSRFGAKRILSGQTPSDLHKTRTLIYG
ncbi:MAG: polysaccharide biosynthesis protein, partial [Mesorhizobium sp.]|nr:polysaccharide biosynthesis protein [Mesorhizobium sp.]